MFLTITPLLLVGFRFCLAPLIIFLAYEFGLAAKAIIVTCIIMGLLSDIFDGVVARRLGVATPLLRRLDSQVDAIFWIAILGCSWILRPDRVHEIFPYVLLLLGLECACYATSLIKFGRETCTHSYLSKLWGLALCIAFVTLVATGYTGAVFGGMVVVGVISQAEVIAITLTLPRWTNDVPSLYCAWKIRNGTKASVRHKPTA